MSTRETPGAATDLPARCQVLVIGAGPGGVCAATELRKAGITDFVILEKATAVGGTWWHNRYPGCECDVQSHLYSYSFEPKHDWSRPYAGQQEILDYVTFVATKYQVMPHCRFGVTVSAATWEDHAHCWRVDTADGRSVRAPVVISAIGMFNEVCMPDIAGLDGFAGHCFHTARWPQEDRLSGARVAIIGSAASAVQTAPEIAATVAQLDLYQRTPQWVLPKQDTPFTPEQLEHLRTHPEALAAHRAELYSALESVILFDNPQMLADAAAAGLDNLAQVHDADLRQRLTPTMRYGCRRPLLSNRYYPMFNRANVALVDCGIENVTADGIVGHDGVFRATDTIILATGFETTRYLSAIDVFGRNGESIHTAWQDGATAYQGITTSGFPNLFMLYGPNTNNGSLITMLELEVAYAVRCIRHLFDSKLALLDVKPQAMAAYNNQLQRDIANITVWGADCRGYYRAPSGRIVTQFPYTMTAFRERLAHLDTDAYEAVPG